MNVNRKRILSLLMILCLTASLFTAAAHAESFPTDLPSTMTVEEGDTVTLYVTFNGIPNNDNAIQWYCNDSCVMTGVYEYSFPAAVTDNGSEYYVRIGTENGIYYSETCTLYVHQASLPPQERTGSVNLTPWVYVDQKILDLDASIQDYIYYGNAPAGVEVIVGASSFRLRGTPTQTGTFTLVYDCITNKGNYVVTLKIVCAQQELVLLKNPSGETVTEGGNALFISAAEGYSKLEWRVVRPDGSNCWRNKAEIEAGFPGVRVTTYPDDAGREYLWLQNIPRSMNGYYIQTKFWSMDGNQTIFTADKGCMIRVNEAKVTPPENVIVPDYIEIVDPQPHKEVIDPAVEPTCTTAGKTEGRHCETCGLVIQEQKPIPKLGHQAVVDPAVPATCESTGLTEGGHCERCGAILVAQKEVPAGEHDWQPATLTRPAVCRVCGVKGEKAEGTAYLIKLCEPMNQKILLPVQLLQQTLDSGMDLTVSGYTDGFGLPDSFLSDAQLRIQTNGAKTVNVQLSRDGEEPIRLILSLDEDGLEFYLPELDPVHYLISGDRRLTLGAKTELRLRDLIRKDLTQRVEEILTGYEETLCTVVNVFNAKETDGSFFLGGIGETIDGTILTITPSKNDWRTMLRTFFRQLQEDEEVDTLLTELGLLTGSVERAEAWKTQLDQWCEKELDGMNALVKKLSGTKIQIVCVDGVVRGIRIDGNDSSYGWSSYEDEFGMYTDLLFADGETLASLQQLNEDGNCSGSFRCDALDVEADYLLNAESRTTLGLPGGLVTIYTENMTAQLRMEDLGGQSRYALEAERDEDSFYVELLAKDGGTGVRMPTGEIRELKNWDAVKDKLSGFAERIQNYLGLTEPEEIPEPVEESGDSAEKRIIRNRLNEE